MAELLEAPQLLALAAALGWVSGLRIYAAVFLVGAAGHLGWLELPAGLQVLTHPGVLAASGFMFFVEFFADKIPWIDSAWDAVHTFIRIPAGAALAFGALGAEGPAAGWIAALLGGTLAATSHATKMTTRAAVNTSPEPFSNLGVSLLEDGAVVVLLWLAAEHPLLFALALVASIVLAIVLMVLLVRFLRTVLAGLRQLLHGQRPPLSYVPQDPDRK